MLEPCEVKVSSTVLGGPGDGNIPRLPDNYSPEQKQQIIETVWQVAYSDGRLDKHEDYFVHKLAGLLNLDHKQLIDAKIRAQKVP